MIKPKEDVSQIQIENPSVFSAKTYEFKKDRAGCLDFDPKKNYTQEIEQDMVNEMIKQFAKSSDRDIKQKISDGINEMDVVKPKDILNRERKRTILY